MPAVANSVLRIDHVAQAMTPDEMPTWRLYYLSLLDFENTAQMDVVDPAGFVGSLALQDEKPALRVCLNASASERTMAARLLSECFGAGMQHIAFATNDIFAAAEACRGAGLELLPTPDNYYGDLEVRLALDPTLVDRLRAHAILYDEDEGGDYFQLYTRAFQEWFFFEIVKRDSYAGNGAANAPIRLAAQTRLARRDGIPKA